MRRLFTILVILFIGVAALPNRVALAQGDRLCFPDVPGIGNCIEGRFREYWQQNGGLPVFGYPITAATPEQTAEGPFLTQYFERNRFELHPEKARPYDVLLGRLGDVRLKQQGRDWTAFPKAPQSADRYFAETGHAIANGKFWNYWASNGLQAPELSAFARSLALFGLPLSDPMMETNASGDTVLTQWFERARFEDHGGKGVLLGLLGNETRGPSAPAERAPAPQPPAPQPPAPQPPSPPPPSFNNCQADPQAGNAPNHPVRIVTIDKGAESVTLRNVSQEPVNLDGWIMCSIRGNQQHMGIGGTLAAGATRAFVHQDGQIWNNFEEDDGALYNPNGQLISYWND